MGRGIFTFLLLECLKLGLQHTRSCLSWHQTQKTFKFEPLPPEIPTQRETQTRNPDDYSYLLIKTPIAALQFQTHPECHQETHQQETPQR